MQDELFGHAQAALLAGCSPSELVSAAGAGFRAAAEAAEAAAAGAGAGTEEAEEAGDAAAVPPLSGKGEGPRRSQQGLYRATMATLEAAWARHRERFPEAAAAVKERERRKVEEGGGGGGGGGDREGGGNRESGNTSSSPTSLSSSSPSPSSSSRRFSSQATTTRGGTACPSWTSRTSPWAARGRRGAGGRGLDEVLVVVFFF